MRDLETRMLSGDRFTMEELKRSFSKSKTEARNIERKVSEFHRLGYIKLERQQLRMTWAATPAGISKLKERTR